jgi:hypothetical protein
MKSIQAFIACFLTVLAGLSFTDKAAAFTLVRGSAGQSNIGWVSSTVTFDYDTSCNSYLANVNSAVGAAANVWNALPTSTLTVQSGSSTTLPSAITTYVGNTASSYAPAGNAIVYCDSSFGAHSGLDANSIPGFATGQNISSSGTIDGCLLVLNVQAGATASITTLNSTVTNTVLAHEIGHCLGFGHSADSNALMYYATGLGRQTVLANDDIDAATYLYPKQDAGSSIPGCSAIASTTGTPGSHRRSTPWWGFLTGDLIYVALFLGARRLFITRRPIR